jgi:hypothetical protein
MMKKKNTKKVLEKKIGQKENKLTGKYIERKLPCYALNVQLGYPPPPFYSQDNALIFFSTLMLIM